MHQRSCFELSGWFLHEKKTRVHPTGRESVREYEPTYSFFSNGWFERIFLIELSRRRWGISLSIVLDLFTRKGEDQSHHRKFKVIITIPSIWIVVGVSLFSLKKKIDRINKHSSFYRWIGIVVTIDQDRLVVVLQKRTEHVQEPHSMHTYITRFAWAECRWRVQTR